MQRKRKASRIHVIKMLSNMKYTRILHWKINLLEGIFFFFILSHIRCRTHCHRMWGTTKRCSMSLGKIFPVIQQILGEQNREQLGSAGSESLKGSSPFLPEWVVQFHPIEMQKPFPMALGFLHLCPFHLGQPGGGVQCE